MEMIKKVMGDVAELKEKAQGVAFVEEEVKMSDVFFTKRMEDNGMMLMDVGDPSFDQGKYIMQQNYTDIQWW